MLRNVLQAVEEAGGVVTTTELSRRTGLDRDLLRDMLEFLAARGRLDRCGTDFEAPQTPCRRCPLAPGCSAPAVHGYAVRPQREEPA